MIVYVAMAILDSVTKLPSSARDVETAYYFKGRFDRLCAENNSEWSGRKLEVGKVEKVSKDFLAMNS